MKDNLPELLAAIAFATLLVIVWNPIGVLMPPMIVSILLIALVAAFWFFAAFVFRERGADERDRLHSLFAGRIAFLAGAAILLAGVVVQELGHALDPWLVTALGVMVAAKLTALIYSKRRL